MPSRPAVRYEVVATGLNLRESGDLAAPVIRQLTRGERLSYVGKSADGKWLKVRHRQRVGWVAAKYVQAGHAGTDSARARSWLNWGKATKSPSVGCVVVLQRDANKGHVGFFVSRTPTHVRLLGGNQQNRVCEQDYPLAHLLGYRAPA
ncbi:MAG: SH3 domain-containing protein [Gemmatimonadetes bacterium]|nr:SH3 domain-containing protein [Gemmatimonadota bacterium]